MIEVTENERAETATESGVPDLENEPHRHPLGAGIGAVLAAGTAGATGGVLVGPLGALVGAVVGAVAGGLGGHAIAEFVDPSALEALGADTYTLRLHVHSTPAKNEDAEGSSQQPDLKPVPRESWGRDDEFSKEHVIDNSPKDDE